MAIGEKYVFENKFHLQNYEEGDADDRHVFNAAIQRNF